MQVKKQQLKLAMGQQIGSKLGKEYVKALCCHTAFLTYMQSMSREMQGWMKHKLESGWSQHKLESRWLGETSVTSDMQMIPPLWEKGKIN